MIRTSLALVALCLVLAGCGNPGPMPTGSGAMADANGMMAMPMPDGRRIDMGKVPQFPGAVMVDMKIMPHQEADMMEYSFNAPAPPAVVRDWYQRELAKAGFSTTKQGDDLVGVGPDRAPFRLTLKAAAGGHTLGVVGKG